MIEWKPEHPWSELVSIVAEFDDDDAEMLLHERERAQAGSFRLQSRAREWMASRIAARMAAARMAQCEPNAVELGLDAIATAAGRKLRVSYSHTGGIGAAAVDDHAVGVDLERIRPLPPRIARFFLSSEEQRWMRELPTIDPLMHLWSAKEAAFKMFGRCTLLSEVALEVTEGTAHSLELLCSHQRQSGRVITAKAGDSTVLAVARISPPQ